MTWFQRLTRKREIEKQLDSELRHHFETLVAAHLRSGLSDPEARRRARLEFGGLEAVKDDCRDSRGTLVIESAIQDLRLAVRTLRQSPLFAMAAIATLALGIGANTAVFQLLDAVFLRPLSVASPDELVAIQIRGGVHGFLMSGDDRLTFALFEGIRRNLKGLSGVMAWEDANLLTGIAPDTQQRTGLYVSGDFFPTLALPPGAGRLLGPADDHQGCAAPGVVLSDAF